MAKLFVKSMLLLLIVAISSGLHHSVSSVAVRASPDNVNSNEELLVFDTINIEAKKKNRFLPLEEFIPEAPIAEFQESYLPQLLNRTSLRINASYSTVIGGSESLVIHQFTIDFYQINSPTNHTLMYPVPLSLYYIPDNPRHNIPELILEPNSSKSEFFSDIKFETVEFGIYKFVFRVQYHVYGQEETTINSYYYRNITFELVKSYPSPPYIIIYAFFGVLFILIIWVVLGIYGNRKYHQNRV